MRSIRDKLNTERWERAFAALSKFRAREGHCCPSRRYMEELSPERRRRLDKVGFFGMYRAWGRLLTNRQDRARTYHVLRGTLPATSRYSPQSAAPRRATWLPRLDKAHSRQQPTAPCRWQGLCKLICAYTNQLLCLLRNTRPHRGRPPSKLLRPAPHLYCKTVFSPVTIRRPALPAEPANPGGPWSPFGPFLNSALTLTLECGLGECGWAAIGLYSVNPRPILCVVPITSA